MGCYRTGKPGSQLPSVRTVRPQPEQVAEDSEFQSDTCGRSTEMSSAITTESETSGPALMCKFQLAR